MNKKEELKRLLKGLTKAELMEIIVESEKEIGPDCPYGNVGEEGESGEEMVHPIDSSKKKRRRGKGTRRKNKEKQPPRSKRSTKAYGNDKGDACRSSAVDTSGDRPNKFDDFMKNTVLTAAEKQELQEASAADNENKGLDRTPRTRSSNIVEIACRSCGVIEDVSSSVVYDIKRWKCNKCSSQACD